MTDYTDEFGRGELNDQVDADRLVEEIGLDSEEIAWRKEFIDFGDDDARRLRRFAEPFRRHADEIADSFYDHLAGYEETRAVIDRSPKDLDDLKQTQMAYLLTLADGEYGEDHFEARARIGKLHDLLDMPLKQYIGQYNVYYGLLLSVVTDRIHRRLSESVDELVQRPEHDLGDVDPDRLTQRLYEDVEEGVDELHSLLKILNLDMQVATDTYLQSRINEVEIERDRFAALFENVPTPVVVVRVGDEQMHVQRTNPAFEKLFGYTAEDLSDYHFERFLTPPDEEPEPIDERTVFDNIDTKEDSELSEAEITLETQFGRREFIRVSAPIDRSGLDDLEYAFYIDVTDQKQRQERLQVLSRVLRHDLRNRLTVIKGNAELLTERRSGESTEAIYEHITNASEELLSTSDRLRRIERLITGDADHKPIDVEEIVDGVLDEMRATHPDCEFEVSTTGSAWANGTEILRVAVENVVENAAEHNDHPEPRVEVNVVESLDGDYVDVRVADNGPGIPPEEYEVLLGERDRSQIEHATGIGLWTVNWIVTKIGGGLDFRSNSPRGSVVTLRLPRAEPPAASTDDEEVSTDDEEAADGDGKAAAEGDESPFSKEE